MLSEAILGIKSLDDFVKLIKMVFLTTTFTDEVLKVKTFSKVIFVNLNTAEFMTERLYGKRVEPFGMKINFSEEKIVKFSSRRKRIPLMGADIEEIFSSFFVERSGELEFLKRG